MDGYDDLLITVKNGNDHVPQIWQSTSCDDGTSACGDDNSGRRYFVRQDNGTQALTNVTTGYAATWFDIGEDGTLDIFALSDSGLESFRTPALHITAFANNVDHGGYYLKTLGLNGLCSQWCLGSDVQPKFPDPKVVASWPPCMCFTLTVCSLSELTCLASCSSIRRPTTTARQSWPLETRFPSRRTSPCRSRTVISDLAMLAITYLPCTLAFLSRDRFVKQYPHSTGTQSPG